MNVYRAFFNEHGRPRLGRAIARGCAHALGGSAKKCRSLNSVGPILTSNSPRHTRRVDGSRRSSAISTAESRACGPLRRSTARTRAINSCVEKRLGQVVIGTGIQARNLVYPSARAVNMMIGKAACARRAAPALGQGQP